MGTRPEKHAQLLRFNRIDAMYFTIRNDQKKVKTIPDEKGLTSCLAMDCEMVRTSAYVQQQ